MGTSLRRINGPRNPKFGTVTAEKLIVCSGFNPDDEHYGYQNPSYAYGFQYGTPPKHQGTTVDCDGIRTDGAIVLDDSLHGLILRSYEGNYFQVRMEEGSGGADLVIDGEYARLYTDDEQIPETARKKTIVTV